MNISTEEQKNQFAAVFGYTPEDQVRTINIQACEGANILTVVHWYRTDQPITYKEKTEYPAKVVGMVTSQFLIKGTENSWVIEHTISRFMTEEETEKVKSFQQDAENNIEDAKIITH